ncbi:sigma-54-dependent transcriptional regulator [Aestuariibaculum sediminum]|uniref:Sigma-54-dependent Fis family transcriptional regulator n=1 Tax=Aestuariibaculum sediminum TaxID=2770637 RepID=A0A8J6QN17_9FLAO|nr:sigma-54 dependent transcriptional regulator [Aestuariibaculum sediminum]MBD0833769.1 sigma-54-dependent Fis family transcriptional regulator [Aestuariibaculum sediminum]
MPKGKILIVDDNKSILSALELLLQNVYKDIKSISNPNQITSIKNLMDYDLVLLDMNFSAGINNGNEGLYWLKRIKNLAPDVSVVMITAYGDIELAVRALKEGATDFILKPWDNKKLLATLQAAFQLRESKRKISALKQKENGLKDIINNNNRSIVGNSKALTYILKLTQKVAKTNANVLITGENGTGKELIAKEIHNWSKRNNEILVSVDMGSITESLFESELFGHIKGAFTDAHTDRIGKFEAAHKGTLFLDEIGNLPLQLQAKLLTVIQNKEIVKIGSNTPIPIDIRLVCATNCNLEKMVEDGLFREDLLYRINTIHLEVPPLRQRENDILLLSDFFLDLFCNKYNKKPLKIDESAQKKLLNHNWPGNIRELQHTIERCVILSDGNNLTTSDFIFKERIKTSQTTFDTTLDDMEKSMISNAISKHEGNYSAAANQLGITRQTLYNKIKRYNL